MCSSVCVWAFAQVQSRYFVVHDDRKGRNLCLVTFRLEAYSTYMKRRASQLGEREGPRETKQATFLAHRPSSLHSSRCRCCCCQWTSISGAASFRRNHDLWRASTDDNLRRRRIELGGGIREEQARASAETRSAKLFIQYYHTWAA